MKFLSSSNWERKHYSSLDVFVVSLGKSIKNGYLSRAKPGRVPDLCMQRIPLPVQNFAVIVVAMLLCA